MISKENHSAVREYNRAVLFRIVLLAAILGYAGINIFYHPKTTVTPPAGFALVELFTSEGCSSCPAAESLALVIDGEQNKNVYILSFHVDYWDRLGWTDKFSSAAFTERQKQYAGIFRLKSIYTPQLVVNGKTEFVGSNETKLRATIQQELKNSPAATFGLTTKVTGAKSVEVSCNLKGDDNTILNIALVQKHAETSVKKGENEGKLLKHINIVRDFRKLTGGRMSLPVAFPVPDGLGAKDVKVVAFVQNKEDLKVMAVAEKDF